MRAWATTSFTRNFSRPRWSVPHKAEACSLLFKKKMHVGNLWSTWLLPSGMFRNFLFLQLQLPKKINVDSISEDYLTQRVSCHSILVIFYGFYKWKHWGSYQLFQVIQQGIEKGWRWHLTLSCCDLGLCLIFARTKPPNGTMTSVLHEHNSLWNTFTGH